MTRPNAPRTARERARAELTREIKEAARRQLAAVGADGLSLRAVSRELGMVSSALYRYYPSRDDLLTALIIDAYTALGEAAEGAIAGVRPGAGADAGRARWVAACGAIRAWAVANPHEYALIYGSPVPGYRAPDATIGPAARVPFALAGVLADAVAAGEMSADPGPVADLEGPDLEGPDLEGPDLEGTGLGGPLAAQAAALSAALVRGATADAAVRLAPAVPADVLVRAVIAWAQLFGMISFELFGQFVGSFEPADALFAYGVAQLASFVGLR
jgi:AcrR family transcriptional regulator